MDWKLIERLDRKRYRAVVMEAVGLLFIFADTLWSYIQWGSSKHDTYVFQLAGGLGNMLSPVMPDTSVPLEPTASNFAYLSFFVLLSGIPLFLFIVGGVKYGRVWLKARRNKEIHAALYDELYIRHKHTYQRLTLWVAIGLMLLIFVFAAIEIIPPRYPYPIVVQMLLLATLLTLKISWLIYNRR